MRIGNGHFGNSRYAKGNDMKFYDREKELRALRGIRNKSGQVTRFTVITGRRRIGKTSLVLEAYGKEPFLYFFVSRKAESDLCSDFVDEIARVLDVPVLGLPSRFSDIFEFLMKLSQSRAFTLVIDEFQDFIRVNKSVFSEMQRIWDLNKQGSRINLLVCGSVNTLMNRIFKDEKEPLYGRQTATMKVKPFAPSVLKDILGDYNPTYNSEDLLSLYLFTGGVAKYVELLMDNGKVNSTDMLDMMTAEDSPFIDEGKNMLVDEFGKDYGMYFSILSFIARGHTTRNDLERLLHTELGGYLSKLKDEYGLVSSQQPMFEKSSNKGVHYTINDNFLRFWFRFIYKYNYMLEVGANDKLRTIIQRDYPTYSGHVLERYFKEVLIESGRYTRIGGWHDRKGENEIDIIAADELGKTVEFYEVKRNKKSIDMSILRSKAEVFLKTTGQFKGYSISYHGLCMADM